MMDNILKLAALQDSGDIPPAAEDAIALLFAERYALELRHVAAWGWWLSYDGTRWARDDTLHAFDRARAICREIAADCERSAQRSCVRENRRRRRAAGQGGSPTGRHCPAMGRQWLGFQHRR